MSEATESGMAPLPRHGRDLRREIFLLVDRGPVRLRSVIIATLGMGVPVVIGLSLDRVEAGFTIGADRLIKEHGLAGA